MNLPQVMQLSGLKDKILAQWEFRVRANIQEANALSEPILTNAMPKFLDNLSEALAATRPFATSNTTLGFSHGRERAAMTHFDCGQVIHELQLLRSVITDELTKSLIDFSQEKLSIIDASINLAIRESALAYSAKQREEVTEFVASFVHDLRNPIHVARATIQLLVGQSSDANLRIPLERVTRQLSAAGLLIDTLLDATAFEQELKLTLNIEAVSLKPLLQGVATDMMLEKQPVLVDGVDLNGFWCKISIRRAVENLISNAQKYGAKGASISVLIEKVDSRAVISVHNEGAEIPKEQLAKLFTGHRRVEDVEMRGWGLGLPFVQRVAEAHGGSVIVESGPTDGTTFQIDILLDARDVHPVGPRDVSVDLS